MRDRRKSWDHLLVAATPPPAPSTITLAVSELVLAQIRQAISSH
jgi:hypothetical protein